MERRIQLWTPRLAQVPGIVLAGAMWWTLALAGAALSAQSLPMMSPFDGTTPAINTPGAPANSYQLSSIEHINHVNGHLNISIPLVDIAGRGGAKETLTLAIEPHWRVQSISYQYACNGTTCSTGISYIPINSMWTQDEPTVSNGALLSRTMGDYCAPGVTGAVNNQAWQNTLTRFTFIAPDGTEYEFRDEQTQGLKQGLLTGQTSLTTAFNRGTVFRAWDGSGAVFTSTQNVTDVPRTGCYQGASAGGSGVIQLRDGTSYTVNGGYVWKIEDRNGNVLRLDNTTINAQPGFDPSLPLTIVDGLGRTTTIPVATVGDQVITYPGYNGATPSIIINRATLSTVMLPGSTVQTYSQLFSGLGNTCSDQSCPWNGFSNTSYNPIDMVASVKFPNNQAYYFKYDAYGNVVQVLLPTGGMYRYTYSPKVYQTGTTGSGQASGWVTQMVLSEKDVYTNSGDVVPAQVIQFSSYTDPTTGNTAMAGQVVYQDGSHTTLGGEIHASYGVNLSPPMDGTGYKNWSEGKEFRVDRLDSDLSVLKSEVSVWHQMGTPDCASVPGSSIWWLH